MQPVGLSNSSLETPVPPHPLPPLTKDLSPNRNLEPARLFGSSMNTTAWTPCKFASRSVGAEVVAKNG